MHQEKIQKLEKAMALPGISADEKAIYAKAIAKLKSEATPAGKKPCADDCHDCHDCKEKKVKAAPPKKKTPAPAKAPAKEKIVITHLKELKSTNVELQVAALVTECVKNENVGHQQFGNSLSVYSVTQAVNKLILDIKTGNNTNAAHTYRVILDGGKKANLTRNGTPILSIEKVSEETPTATKSVNCQILDKDGKPDISPAAVKQLEECAENLPQTKDKYFKDGKYTPERKALHDKIIKSFKKDKPCVDDSREPVCILTGGPPGSGKSTWLAKYLPWATKDRVYHIDADEVRAMLPEYKGWNATSTHVETKDVVNRLIDEIGKPCEYDLIYDGTMNKATSYDALVDKIRKLGYKVFIIYISVPKKVSEQRVLERYRKRGRYVPKIVIDEVYEKGLTAFEKLAKEADGFIHVDGESGKIVDKGGMPLPDGKRFEKPTAKPEAAKPAAPAAPKKGKNETREELKAKAKTREELVADAEKQIEKIKSMSESQIIDFGLKFNAQRGTATALKDGLGDNKARLSPTPENLIRWMRNPGKFDLIGVDTFERTDPTKDYKKEISIQKFWNNIFGIKHNIS
jgi:predicted ABC-type ATPase